MVGIVLFLRKGLSKTHVRLKYVMRYALCKLKLQWMNACVTALKGKEKVYVRVVTRSWWMDESFSMGGMIGKRRADEENAMLIFSVLKFSLCLRFESELRLQKMFKCMYETSS
jgi:hypothetical protein